MRIEPNNIYLGNSYELIKDIPDKSVDLIVTDPPYEFKDGGRCGILKNRKKGNSYDEIVNKNMNLGIDTNILNEFVRVMKKINIYIWCNKEQIYDYLSFFVKEHGCNWEMIIWAKNNPAPFLNGHYLKDKEYCLYFWEKGVKVKPTFETGKTVYISNLNVRDKKDYGHPCIKPEDIIENLIKNSSERGGVVFDAFLGSGTTCAVAKRLGRRYIGIEINEKYYEIAKDRLKGITQKDKKVGQMSLLELLGEEDNEN